MDLIDNSAVTIRDYGTTVHKRKLVLELMQGRFLTNRPPQWLALYGYLRCKFITYLLTSHHPPHHVPPGAMLWPSEILPPATTATMGLRWWAGDNSPCHAVMPARHQQLLSHASDHRRSWSVTPGVRLAVTLAYFARHNGGSGRAAKSVPAPPPLTPLIGATPLATPPHSGPPGPRRRRRARH